MSLIIRRLVRPEDAPTLITRLPQSPNGYGQVLSPHRHEAVLTRLLREGAVRGVMLVNTALNREALPPGASAHPDQVVGFALTGFISLAHERALLDEGGCIVESIYRREEHGEPCLLRPPAQAECNRGEGMTLVFLHFFSPPGGPGDAEFQQAITEMQDCFRLQHAGFNCRAALHPVDPSHPAGMASLLSIGFVPVSTQLVRLDLAILESSPFHPFVCLLRRQHDRLGFSPGERQLLELALWQYDDAQIARALHISVETVRKRWRSVFQKVDADPALQLFDAPGASSETATRGPEKRTKLLRYLDSHLSEIRP